MEMAVTEPLKACTQWCDDMQWENLEGPLPRGVVNRLMGAKRALYAANIINALLFKDHLGKADKDDNDAEFEGLDPIDVEGLRMAAIELSAHAEQLLEEVQGDSYGCVTGKLR